MDYVYSVAKSTSQTRLFQWTINKARSVAYPWVYNKWEANRILDNENLWLGSLESACDRETMRVHNIKYIVTAVYDINPIFDDPDLWYLKVPVIDKPDANIAKHFKKAIEFIDEAIDKGSGVLVHCVYGISRSSTLICAYLIAKKKMTVSQAIKHVKDRRPIADPNRGFLVQLQALWEDLRKQEDEEEKRRSRWTQALYENSNNI